MLVKISDLHISDNSLAFGSINRAMAKYFRHNMSRIMQEKGLFERAKPLEFCMLGDCLDILRSDIWYKEGIRTRPWSSPSKEQEEVVFQIVSRIIKTNLGVFEEFCKLLKSYDSKLIYILGNHDQLLGTYESVQQLVIEALGMDKSRVVFCMEYTWPEYGVYSYHGHKHDFRNYDIPRTSLGTISFVELLNRLPYEMSKVLDEGSVALKHIKEMPCIELSAAGYWIDEILSSLGGDRVLRKCFRKVVKQYFTLKVVRGWFFRNLFSSHWLSAVSFQFSLILLMFMPLWVCRIIAGFASYLVEGTSVDQILLTKSYEELNRHTNKNIRYVVCGHTHFFRRIPLGMYRGKEVYYLNTGSWGRAYERSRSYWGKTQFIPKDSMSYLVFFKPDEKTEFSFEVWNGSLGPMN